MYMCTCVYKEREETAGYTTMGHMLEGICSFPDQAKAETPTIFQRQDTCMNPPSVLGSTFSSPTQAASLQSLCQYH